MNSPPSILCFGRLDFSHLRCVLGKPWHNWAGVSLSNQGLVVGSFHLYMHFSISTKDLFFHNFYAPKREYQRLAQAFEISFAIDESDLPPEWLEVPQYECLSHKLLSGLAKLSSLPDELATKHSRFRIRDL